MNTSSFMVSLDDVIDHSIMISDGTSALKILSTESRSIEIDGGYTSEWGHVHNGVKVHQIDNGEAHDRERVMAILAATQAYGARGRIVKAERCKLDTVIDQMLETGAFN